MSHQQTMRARLADATRRQHDGLHVHPLFSRLMATDLTLAEYQACLAVNHAFFQSLEAVRKKMGAFPALTLAPQLRGLAGDLPDPMELERTFCLKTKPGILGSLYVAHGSGFGKAVMAGAIARSLPDAPRGYFGAPHDRTVWRALLAQLEAVDTRDHAAVITGARRAFHHMARLADDALTVAA